MHILYAIEHYIHFQSVVIQPGLLFYIFGRWYQSRKKKPKYKHENFFQKLKRNDSKLRKKKKKNIARVVPQNDQNKMMVELHFLFN